MDNWRELIQKGLHDVVLRQMAEQSVSSGNSDLHNAVTMLLTRWNELDEREIKGTIDPDELRIERNKISSAMLDLLPQFAPPQPAKKTTQPGISEERLKQHILFLTLAVKFVVLGWLYTQYQAGGYSEDQFVGVLTLLAPVMATYIGAMFQDFLDHRHVAPTDKNAPRVRKNVQWTVYGAILAYGWALILVIGLKPQGTVTFTQLSAVLAVMESLLGIYLSRIVKTFFKGNEK